MKLNTKTKGMSLSIQNNINLELRKLALEKNFHNLQDTVNFILSEYFKIKLTNINNVYTQKKVLNTSKG